MATYKMSFANLLAFFERKSHEDTRIVGNECIPENTKGPVENEKAEGGRDLGADVKEEVNALVQGVWEKLIAHLNGCHPNVMEQLFCMSAHSSGNEGSVKVAREIFKRELMTMIGNAYGSLMKEHGNPGRLDEQQCEVNSLKRRLGEMNAQASRAEGALREERKERYYVQFERDEYEEKYSKLRSAFCEWKTEQEELQKGNAFLLKKRQALELENDKLRSEKNASDIRALRARHDAEMAQLVATQSALHAKALDKQLKESKRSVGAIRERVEELQRVQEVMKALLANTDKQHHRTGGRLEGLVHKSSMVLGFLGSALTRRQPGAQGNRSEEHEERAKATDTNLQPKPRAVREDNEEVDGSTPMEVVEGAGDRQLGMVHKLTGRLRKIRGRKGTVNASGARGTGFVTFQNVGGSARPGSAHTSSDEGEQGTSAGLSRLAALKLILSSTSSGRREQTSGGRPLRSRVSKTLDTLETNLAAWRELVDDKHKEVDRLHAELRAAIQQSDGFEQRLRNEQHKRLIAKLRTLSDRSENEDSKYEESSTAEEVGARNSCRTF